MGKLKVGVLYGGRSVEHDISLLSAKNILQNIDTGKFDISLLYDNGSDLGISKFSRTDLSGIAFISLYAEQSLKL